jgi:uncharacterized protein YkwD
LHSIRDVRAALRAPHESLLPVVTRHRAVTRVTLTAVALAIVFVISQQSPSQAGRAPERPSVASSLLPANVGIGIATDEAITLAFDQPMDRASVEASLSVRPAQPLAFGWSPDGRSVRIGPATRWQTDQRYVVQVPAEARTGGGAALGTPANVSFTTETAPTVTDFRLRFAPATENAAAMQPVMADDAAALSAPADTANRVSARTAITLAFSAPMNHAATEAAFVVTPAVEGSFSWTGSSMRFEPLTPLVAGDRYAVSVVGARDAEGNRIGGDTSFSFNIRDGAQVASVSPKAAAKGVTGRTITLRFTEPMNVASVRSGFSVKDAVSGARVSGKVTWNRAHTYLKFTADRDFTLGHAYTTTLAGATDVDGNAVSHTSSFRTAVPVVVAPVAAVAAAPVATARPRPPVPAPSGSGVALALNQINASRAQYGFAPLVLDNAITNVANAHAWDMMNYGYFSHTGRDGSSVRTRLSRAGVPYSHAGENICEYTGIGMNGTLNWCHSAFMSEPYPGYNNHIANILDPDFRRVGVGIAVSGGKVVVVWDFAG